MQWGFLRAMPWTMPWTANCLQASFQTIVACALVMSALRLHRFADVVMDSFSGQSTSYQPHQVMGMKIHLEVSKFLVCEK